MVKILLSLIESVVSKTILGKGLTQKFFEGVRDIYFGRSANKHRSKKCAGIGNVDLFFGD